VISKRLTSIVAGGLKSVSPNHPISPRTDTVMISTECLPEHRAASIEGQTTAIIDEIMDSLPDPEQLTSEERRGIIARYSSVLEGNFIYWMTATVIAVKAKQSRPIVLDNLTEEVRDAHPIMMRKVAVAGKAFPTAEDAWGV